MEEHPLQHSNSNQKLPTTGPAAAAYHQWCRFILDLILFYTTAFFVLLAIVSLFALVFLVPFFIDPAWSTLQADFDSNGTKCTTISGKYLKGMYKSTHQKIKFLKGSPKFIDDSNIQPFEMGTI